MNEQHIQSHREAIQLDIPGLLDLQVTLVSEFNFKLEYIENICPSKARCSGLENATDLTGSSYVHIQT